MYLREDTLRSEGIRGAEGSFLRFLGNLWSCHSDGQGNLGFLYAPVPCLSLVLHAYSPLAGICQGFLRTCIYVNSLGNHAMTSLASVILRHPLASFPCPDTLNNCSPECSTTTIDCVCKANLQLVGSPGRKELHSMQQGSLYLKSKDLVNPATYLCDLGKDSYPL